MLLVTSMLGLKTKFKILKIYFTIGGRFASSKTQIVGILITHAAINALKWGVEFTWTTSGLILIKINI